MGRYDVPRGELPRRRVHEEAMRAKVPGKMSQLTSRRPTKSNGMACDCEVVKKSECERKTD